MFTTSVTRTFFDRPGIVRRMSRARRRALSKAGAYVRTRARTSIRRKRGRSAPGRPPHGHTGLLRGGIYFAYDELRDNVIVGAAKLRSGSAAQALEHGGPSTAITWRRGRRQRRRIYVRRRPFMAPALAAEIRAGTIAKAWQGQFK